MVAPEGHDPLKVRTLAVLHDVPEDQPAAYAAHFPDGLPEDGDEILGLLTHARPVPYPDYVRRLRGNAVARAIKLADVQHSVSRLAALPDRVKAAELEVKYEGALRLLAEAWPGHGPTPARRPRGRCPGARPGARSRGPEDRRGARPAVRVRRPRRRP